MALSVFTNKLDRTYLFYTLSKGSHEAADETLRYIQRNFETLQGLIFEEGLIEVFTNLSPFLQTQAQIDIMKAMSEMISNMSGKLRELIHSEMMKAQDRLITSIDVRNQFFDWSGDVKPDPGLASSITSINLVLLVLLAFVKYLI